MKKIHLYCCNFGNLISSSFAITPQTRIYACELRKPTGFSGTHRHLTRPWGGGEDRDLAADKPQVTLISSS